MLESLFLSANAIAKRYSEQYIRSVFVGVVLKFG